MHATYAPGVIVKKGLEKTYQVRFYDGTEGMIRKSETHRVEPERFENIVDFILQLEQRWIDENVIARDDKTGVYKIGKPLAKYLGPHSPIISRYGQG